MTSLEVKDVEAKFYVWYLAQTVASKWEKQNATKKVAVYVVFK